MEAIEIFLKSFLFNIFMGLFGKKKTEKKTEKKTTKKKDNKVDKKSKSKTADSSSKMLSLDRDEWPIKFTAIIEILGAPKEHVEETMAKYIEKIKSEKTVKLVGSEISEAEQKDKFFSQFAEIELLVKNTDGVIVFCFNYMPSSIEIMEPETIKFNSHQLSGFFNDLQGRLHQLDMLVKNLRAENKILSDNSKFILRNNILLSLKDKDKDLATISKNIGLPEEKSKAFLDQLVKQGFINENKDKYSLNKERVSFSD